MTCFTLAPKWKASFISSCRFDCLFSTLRESRAMESWQLNIERIATVLILALYPICTASAMQDEPDIGSPRSIRIVVSAKFQEGNPIQGMPMTLFWTDQSMTGMTDEKGLAVFEIDVLPEVTWSDLRLFGASAKTMGIQDKMILDSMRELRKKIRSNYSLDTRYHLDFDSTLDDYRFK